jgi:voltage-gated sodium channel
LRARAAGFIEAPIVQRFIIGLILLNAVTLGMETSPTIMGAIGPMLLAFDRAVLFVFALEIAIKLFAYGWRFFRDGWNVFDFLVVGIALLPASGALSVLRALRILRVLRLLSLVPSMRRVVSALLAALPGMGAIMSVLALVFYVAAVMATKLFGAENEPLFGSIGASMYTLFQVMTLDGWSDSVVRPVLENNPYAWAFFLPFIVITSFAVLNLFIGIIVNSLQELQAAEQAATQSAVTQAIEQEEAAVMGELKALRAEIALLQRALEVKR